MSARPALSRPVRLPRIPGTPRLRTAAAAAALVTAALTGLGAAPAQAATACAAGDHCLLDVRTGAHPDYDRVVFDVSDSAPALTVTPSATGAYIGPRGDEQHPSIPGSSYLMVDVSPTVIYTYSTPNPDAVGLQSLKGVQLLYSDEGETEFALSLGTYSSYQVSRLTAPDRLIVDVYH